jgi:predicted flap endonuclease-1-like 5' DNA nuclease
MTVTTTTEAAVAPIRRPGRPAVTGSGSPAGATSLPVGKLGGVPPQALAILKGRRITLCSQLLAVAGKAVRREALAASSGLDPDLLLRLVQRADRARLKGVGVVFGRMLEDLGVRDVQTLAAQDPEVLHARLRAYNLEERLARRSPTPEEVADWVEQARGLPALVGYRAEPEGR